MLSLQKKTTINLISARISKYIYLIQSWKILFAKKKLKQKLKKKINMSEVFSLSVTVSLVFVLSSFHSFFVNQELVVNNSILGSIGFYMISSCIATLRSWCSKEMYCHDCEEIFSRKGKYDNDFQVIWNYEEKREVLKSSGTTRNSSVTNHRKKINVMGQETGMELSE